MKSISYIPIIKFNLKNINPSYLEYLSEDSGESLFPPTSLLWYRSIVEPVMPIAFVIGIMISRRLFAATERAIASLSISLFTVFLLAVVFPFAIAKFSKWTRLYKNTNLNDAPNLAIPILPFSIRMILRIITMCLTLAVFFHESSL